MKVDQAGEENGGTATAPEVELTVWEIRGMRTLADGSHNLESAVLEATRDGLNEAARKLGFTGPFQTTPIEGPEADRLWRSGIATMVHGRAAVEGLRPFDPGPYSQPVEIPGIQPALDQRRLSDPGAFEPSPFESFDLEGGPTQAVSQQQLARERERVVELERQLVEERADRERCKKAFLDVVRGGLYLLIEKLK